ncbi:C39 family peptidase [Patescibacteria group bacterium]|nr:C39 family peptidase [Patescibacteria group bacterium]
MAYPNGICDSGFYCSAIDGGTCMKKACSSGAKQCNGNVLKTCKADGSGWNQITCQYGCANNACKTASVCGALWEPCCGAACDSGLYCSPIDGGTCMKKVCSSGEKQCAGNALKTCKADGTGWNQTTCQYDCVNGACTATPSRPLTAAKCLNHGLWVESTHTCYLENEPVSGGYIACRPGTGRGYNYWHLYQGESCALADSSTRPTTEQQCSGQGLWLESNRICYLENDLVSGGYIACPPGTGKGLPYWHLYQRDSCRGCGAKGEPCCGGSNGTCNSIFNYCDNGTCLIKQAGGGGGGGPIPIPGGFFLQTDPQWRDGLGDDDFSVTVSCTDEKTGIVYKVVKTLAQIGCGPTSVANILNEYSGLNVTPAQIARQIISWACGGTSYEPNLTILEANGYQADLYPKSLYRLTEYMQSDETLWISGNVDGIPHHTYMDGFTCPEGYTENGICPSAVFTLRDPFFGTDITCTVSSNSTFDCTKPDGTLIIIKESSFFILTPPES